MVQGNRLFEWANQFAEIRRENQASRMRDYRVQDIIDEEDMILPWREREYLEEKIYQTFREAIVSSSPDSYTIINSRIKCSFDYSWLKDEITKETDTKLEDVDLDEFEKVLNGG